MKRNILILLALTVVFLAACGNGSERTDENVPDQTWTANDPNAQAFVKLEEEGAAGPGEEPEQGTPITFEDIYDTQGDFYAVKWEMKMFREELPQDEPYDFVVRTGAMLSGNDTRESHIALAEKFTDLGCQVIVKEMKSVEQGEETLAWVTIVTAAPAHMWEIGKNLGEQMHIEQLYRSVDIRFDKQIWPEE